MKYSLHELEQLKSLFYQEVKERRSFWEQLLHLFSAARFISWLDKKERSGEINNMLLAMKIADAIDENRV